MSPIDILDLLDRLSGCRLLVMGDLILDHYVHGSSERISPEAPVPVVVFQSEEWAPGGAANVARNICAAGGKVWCAGVTGRDSESEMLLSQMRRIGADCQGVLRLESRRTTTKTRIVSHGQQMLRLDREDKNPIPPQAEEQLAKSCLDRLAQCQAVAISDYGKGALTPRVLRTIIEASRKMGIPLFVDPKGRDYSRYRGAWCLTPNTREACEATGRSEPDEQGIHAAAQALLEITDCRNLVITRGPEGLSLFGRGREPLRLHATAREVFDVTGAGDTFISFMAMGVAAGADAADAARLANAAAGVVVGKIGAATVSRQELRAAIMPGSTGRKLRSASDLQELGEQLRAAGKRIVFTNGCFDFIHAGHVVFLRDARALGDVLVLATNTDDAITRLKGAPRPIIKQTEREKILAAMESVDYIVPFADDTPREIIRALKPDILVKGNNYAPDQVEGHEIVREYGGRVVLLELFENLSTRNLISGASKAD
ncbi:MAG: D-glycero-beta-D-manno-heptose-7-phosphate kinase [bacterium]